LVTFDRRESRRTFVAFDKSYPPLLVAEAFDPAGSFKGLKALELLKPKATSTAFVRKRPSYFLLSKATKVRLDSLRSKGNQRKMPCCESSARKCGADAGTRHTGHPCPGGARRASMRVALRVCFCSRELDASQRWMNYLASDSSQAKPKSRCSAILLVSLIFSKWSSLHSSLVVRLPILSLHILYRGIMRGTTSTVAVLDLLLRDKSGRLASTTESDQEYWYRWVLQYVTDSPELHQAIYSDGTVQYNL